MRGTIIMWSGEKGVATAGGQRYDFDINSWLGAVAPAANMTVELMVDGGKLTGIKPVDDAEIAKEKLAAITGSNGKGIFLLLLATATIAVPYLWKHKFAPLAFAVPLLFTIYAFWPMWEKYRGAKKLEAQMGEEMRQLAEAFGQMAQQMGGGGGSDKGGLGFGAYIIFAAVLYLAYKGVTRFLGRA